MRVKICGITNLEDALNAIKAGADALGFVFYEPSPRYITPSEAKNIVKKLPPFVKCVGLFVNEESAKIDEICSFSNMDLAQIHFEADETLYKELGTKYIKVIRAKSKEDIKNLKDEYYLVDAFVDSYGGEGKRVALEWFEGLDCSNLILAGGLNAQNLLELKGYNFYALDVSSGVELSKGKKDNQKMIDFVKTAKELNG